MSFSGWNEVINMGGYGFFVWLSFGVTLAALAALMIHGLITRRSLQQQSKLQQQRQQRLARRKQQERSR
ncbi:heme exporter protein CcmD [Pseudidiomarina sp.]|uniref:heme exporter protein CcmD n=1 Tax=Pseudidiomarina sp. TaxID=2081707 RepID=UPI00299E756C|nr:heme exporter protein CcmD [Pseudidiomarina sp.]MDX1706664.1 heme exporter protein CcmD [Pseudidiomarina sp.]